jgi:serine protease Do
MKSRKAKTIAGIALVSLLLISGLSFRRASAEAADKSLTTRDGPSELSAAFRKAAEKAQPSIVTIETYSGPRETARWATRRNPDASEVRSDSGSAREHEAPGARDGEGTGIIIDTGGYILTCNHVVKEADMLFVKLQDGRRFEVVRTLQDPFTDVAVVQIKDAGPLPAADLAGSDNLSVGDWVVTIGNPYGLGVSLSGGVVSATRRHLPHIPYAPLIQTDAATNPGNSGGALVDLSGKVVGMSEGGYGVHEGFQGIGFAIPIRLAEKIARELIADGRVSRPFFGIETEELTIDMGQYLGLEKNDGLIVCDVAPKSPAAKAGIQVGDVLTHVGDAVIEDHFQFFDLVDAEVPFPSMTLTVIRNGAEKKIDVLPEPFPVKRTPMKAQNVNGRSSEYFDKKLGVAVDDFTSETAERLGYNAPVDGVLLTYVDPEGDAAKQGVCAGMGILRVNGVTIHNADEYREAIQESDVDKGVLLLLGTSRAKHFVLCQE